MLLTHPFRRAVVLDRLLDTLVIADGQRRFIRIAPNEVPSQRASFVAFALAGASWANTVLGIGSASTDANKRVKSFFMTCSSFKISSAVKNNSPRRSIDEAGRNLLHLAHGPAD
jgi:hypothetical protein